MKIPEEFLPFIDDDEDIKILENIEQEFESDKISKPEAIKRTMNFLIEKAKSKGNILLMAALEETKSQMSKKYKSLK